MKDLYILAHEELIAEFLDLNPMVSWTVAYEQTQEHVEARLADKLAAQYDQWRNQQENQHG